MSRIGRGADADGGRPGAEQQRLRRSAVAEDGLGRAPGGEGAGDRQRFPQRGMRQVLQRGGDGGGAKHGNQARRHHGDVGVRLQPWIDGGIDARRDLDAGDHRPQQRRAGTAAAFRERQRRRDVADAGMATDEVVQLEDVAPVAIVPGRGLRRQGGGGPQQARCAAAATGRGALRLEHHDGLGRLGAGQDAADRVQDAQPCLPPHRLRDPLEIERGGEAGERVQQRRRVDGRWGR